MNAKTAAGSKPLERRRVEVDGAERVLLASGFGLHSTGGGLFAYNGQELERIDRLTSTGMYATEDRLLRVLWMPKSIGTLAELLVYDSVGVERYYRLDGISGVHDVAWDGSNFLIVSTATNEVVWFSPSGRRVRTWRAPGAGDSWHLNSLLLHEGRTLVGAFGQFQHTRQWDAAEELGSGLIFDLDAGRPVLEGLHCPHNPRPLDDGWLVCNSRRGELLHLASDGRTVRQRVQLGTWPRGLAVADDVIFVGESAIRTELAESGTASIAILCRDTLQVLERLPLPTREVYDLVLVRPELMAGVRRGFSTNPLRVQEQDQYALFREAGLDDPTRLWATGDRLPADACRVSVAAIVPHEMTAGEEVELEATVENFGTAALVSAPPHPVHVSGKWFEAATLSPLQDAEGVRTLFKRALFPGQPQRLGVTVQAPPEPGDYVLAITLVQEGVAWFDDLHPDNACRAPVRVNHSDGAGSASAAETQ